MLQLRAARPEDSHRLARFLARNDPGNPKGDEEVLSWQYWKSPFGAAVSFVYEDDGEIVSHEAKVPIAMTIGGRPALGAISVDAATAPSYRRRGLYSGIVEALNDECRRRNVVVSFHVQGRESQLPSGRADPTQRMRQLVLPVDGEELARGVRVPRPLVRLVASELLWLRRGPKGREVAGPPSDIDRLWESVRPVYAYGTVRDAVWWRWRYGEHPRVPYRFFEQRRDGTLVAAAVTRDGMWRGIGTARILDLLATDREAAREVLRAVAAAGAGSAITTLCSERSPLESLLKRAGLRSVPLAVDRLGLWLRVRDLAGVGDVGSARWSTTLGDLDHV